MIARCYRQARDWNGPVGNLEDAYVGDVDVILGGPTPEPIRGFPGVVSTEGMLGIKRGPIDVAQGDRLVVNGVLYAITGPKQWNFRNELTGTLPDYYWCEAKASHRPGG